MHQHHALVDDGARGQADRVIAGGARVLHVVDGVGDHLAGEEQAALERLLVVHALALADEDLAVQRLGRPSRSRRDRWNRPAPRASREPASPSSAIALLTISSTSGEALRIARHEQVADAVLRLPRAARCRAWRIRRRRSGAGSAPGCRSRRRIFGSAPTAPRWSRFSQDREALLDDVVRLAVLHVGDEADAAGILLVRGIVEALGRREGRDRARRGGAWCTSCA